MVLKRQPKPGRRFTGYPNRPKDHRRAIFLAAAAVAVTLLIGLTMALGGGRGY